MEHTNGRNHFLLLVLSDRSLPERGANGYGSSAQWTHVSSHLVISHVHMYLHGYGDCGNRNSRDSQQHR